jgi:hypothetical protein
VTRAGRVDGISAARGTDSRGPHPGLCGSCRNARIVESRRGSRFYLCLLAGPGSPYPKYPSLPVVTCTGYDPVSEREDDRRVDLTTGNPCVPSPRSGLPPAEIPGERGEDARKPGTW